MINIEEEYDEAGEEEEKGKMQHGRQRFNRPRKVQLVDTLRKERTDPCPMLQTVAVSCLSSLDVPTGPLLQ